MYRARVAAASIIEWSAKPLQQRTVQDPNYVTNTIARLLIEQREELSGVIAQMLKDNPSYIKKKFFGAAELTDKFYEDLRKKIEE